MYSYYGWNSYKCRLIKVRVGLRYHGGTALGDFDFSKQWTVLGSSKPNKVLFALS